MAALVLDERIYETSTTTGTGSYTLAGAVTGFQPFSVLSTGNYGYYFATDDTNWEVGIGTYTSGPDTLARTAVLASSNGDAAVNWGAGTKKIRCGLPAYYALPRQTSKSVAGGTDVTLTALEQRVQQLVLTGLLTANINVIVDTTKWRWVVKNNTTGAYTVTLKTSAGTGIVVVQGESTAAHCDGTNVEAENSVLVPDAQGDVVVGESAGAPVSVPFPLAGAQIINGKIAFSVGSSALTAALKGLDGNDPSPTNPVFVRMPQGNPFDGTYALRKVTAALSVVVSSGSTLGHTSAVACPIYAYLIDNAGVLEMAVSTKFFGGVAVVSTTAEGGAGAADTATTMYSTTARSNVPAACLLRWKSTQTTAGTWAAVTGEVQLFPWPYKKPSVQAFTSSGTYTRPWDLLWGRIRVKAGGGSGGGSSAATYGGGGGEGETAWKLVDAAAIAASETVTIGAGGVAIALNTNSDGNNGGTTSFGSHVTATGGQAGKSGNTTGAGGAGGAAGTGSDWKEAGATGHTGLLAAVGGILSPGGGRGGGLFNTAGATNSGGGGGGGSTAAASGAGAAGDCLVEEFY